MKKCFVAAAVAALLPGAVFAADWNFNGFISAGGGIVLDDGQGYYGFDDSLSFDEDSKVGIQIDAQLTDKVSATVQFMGRGRDNWDAEIEWAYVAYEFNDHWKGRVGRLRGPYFMVSDYLEVGYANPWIRPPAEIYSQLPMTAFEGMDVIYSNNLGAWDFQAQAYVAAYDEDISLFGADASMDLNDMFGLAVTVERDWLMLRASYHEAQMNIDVAALNELFVGIEMAGGGLIQAGTMMGFQPLVDAGLAIAAVPQDLSLNEKTGQFLEAGFVIDTDNSWFLRGEWTTLKFDRSVLSKSESYYVTAGIRHDAFTYHLTFADTKSTPEGGYSDPITAGSALLGSIDPTNAAIPSLDFLAATVDGMIGGPTGRDTWTLGTRWDFAENTAFKLEYAQTQSGPNDYGVVSFVLDVLF